MELSEDAKVLLEVTEAALAVGRDEGRREAAEFQQKILALLRDRRLAELVNASLARASAIASARLAVLCGAVMVVYWPGLLAAAVVPRWGALAIGLPLTSRLDPRALCRPVAWLLIGGWTWALLSIATAPDRLGATQTLFFLTLFSIAFIAAAACDNFDRVMTGFAVGLSVSSALCVAQLAGWNWPFANSMPSGLFFNRSVMAELAAPIAVWAAVSKRWLWVVVALFPVAVCDSRAADLMLALGLLYGWRAPWKPKAIVALALAGLSIAAILWLSPGKYESAILRFRIWELAAFNILPFGRGLGWFQATFPNLAMAHSDMLEMAVELGIGALFWFAIPVLIFWKGSRDERPARATLVACCVGMLVSFPLHSPANGLLVAVVAGFLSGRGRLVWLGHGFS